MDSVIFFQYEGGDRKFKVLEIKKNLFWKSLFQWHNLLEFSEKTKQTEHANMSMAIHNGTLDISFVWSSMN